MQLVAEDRDAARLEPDHRRAAFDLAAQDVEDLAQLELRQVEHSVVVQRPSAAEPLLLHRNLPAGVFQDFDRRAAHFRMEEIVEGVRPEDHALAPLVDCRPRLEPGAERDRRELRHPAAGSDSSGKLEEPEPREPVRQPRHARRQPRPPVDEPHRVRAAGPQPAPVMMSEELGLVGGHVDIHRAIAFASLARQAQVERLFHVLVAPLRLKLVALQQFKK